MMLRHARLGLLALVLAGCGGGSAGPADLSAVARVPPVPPGLELVEVVPLAPDDFAGREGIAPAEIEEAGLRNARVAQFSTPEGLGYAEALAAVYDDPEAGLGLVRAHVPAGGRRHLPSPELGDEAWADELRDLPRDEPILEVAYRVAWRRGNTVVRVTLGGPRGLVTLAAARRHAERLEAALSE